MFNGGNQGCRQLCWAQFSHMHSRPIWQRSLSAHAALSPPPWSIRTKINCGRNFNFTFAVLIREQSQLWVTEWGWTPGIYTARAQEHRKHNLLSLSAEMIRLKEDWWTDGEQGVFSCLFWWSSWCEKQMWTVYTVTLLNCVWLWIDYHILTFGVVKNQYCHLCDPIDVQHSISHSISRISDVIITFQIHIFLILVWVSFYMSPVD